MLVIAEIGINHNGSLDIAKQLINMAIRCGCDAVKFQKRDIETCYTQEFLNSPRQSPWGTTQREQKKGLEFDKEQYDEIDAYCKLHNIPWFASAWDMKSQLFLQQYDLKYNKIASKMVTNLELVETVAREGKLTFISLGAGDSAGAAIDILTRYNCPFIPMHCVMKYPCQLEECRLGAIPNILDIYGKAGYSSHFPGASLDTTIAVTLGATALEKHITLDRAAYGTDQSASVEERGLFLMVRDARSVGRMM